MNIAFQRKLYCDIKGKALLQSQITASCIIEGIKKCLLGRDEESPPCVKV